mmetsp:Transcript_4353/g.8775  ORF Transcript_4353/g.8775 Transcript_4353/m.8775 type:complete len:612 (+) Transcript_4353:175-2010(+)|eukprot:CAMPEP_0118650150 /NCGR_PEP_ID=MMETSP0785-20121206/10091_1 /TAXON_ID=91992 /ORGANISM="Bolidomonas pacifica, Strain CCMP 1866" /LENGTH=611 /DNA_ID=CAMNT_0006542501 /DNA_START=147 /DNA_END=1979 /DNA_ORIENTATION=+
MAAKGVRRFGSGGIFLGYLLVTFLLLPVSVKAQFRNGTSKFEQKMKEGQDELREIIQSHDDVKEYFFPDKLFANIDIYRTEIPLSQDFTIGVMVNPCGDNSTGTPDTWLGYDCCVARFGDGEYGFLQSDAVEAMDLVYPSFRNAKSDPPIRAGAKEIFENIALVDDRGEQKTIETSRRADDEIVVDEECKAIRDPHPYCMGARLRKKMYSQMAACTDNNETVNAMLDCYTADGELSSHCMQVSYTQSAFLHICGGEFADDPHCGTFLEIHRLNGSPIHPEDTLLGETKILTRETSGMMTTTIPLTYRFDPTKILCEFKETVIREGTMVLIKEQAPTCCCPAVYNTLNREGRFMCPNKPGTSHGPFADRVDTLEEEIARDASRVNYPFCPKMSDEEDIMACSKQIQSGFSQDTSIEKNNGEFGTQMRYYSTPCAHVNRTGNETTGFSWTSPDLASSYKEKCEYFPTCGKRDAGQTVCIGADDDFTFAGYIGKVVSIPDNLDDPNGIYTVTFNDGRTTYNFLLSDIEMQEPDYNYELWFVQRTPYDLVIQQRKPFKVISPKCTYDIVNQRYFPYAQLDDKGVPMNQGNGGFDGKIDAPDYTDGEVFYPSGGPP